MAESAENVAESAENNSPKPSTATTCSETSDMPHTRFTCWLVNQISSGNYLGLEWIEGSNKKIFKIPWTKQNFPNWAEHHKIFEDWAMLRGRWNMATGQPYQSFSQMKSNFRTILRKCDYIKELHQSHQLGLQVGNYKVYKLLSDEEAKAEIRKARPPKKRKPYKKRATKASKLKDITPTIPGDFPKSTFDIDRSSVLSTSAQLLLPPAPCKPISPPVHLVMATTKYSNNLRVKEAININSMMGSSGSFISEIKSEDMESDSSNQYPYNQLRTVEEPTSHFENIQMNVEIHSANSADDSSQNSYLNTAQIDPKEANSNTHSALTTVYNSVAHSTSVNQNAGTHVNNRQLPKEMDGFQMLLEAAQIASSAQEQHSASDQSEDETINNPPKVGLRPQKISIADILIELQIPPDELFTYKMNVRYQTKNVVKDMMLTDMSYGYRVQYGSSKDQEKSLIATRKLEAIKDFDSTPVSLPESDVPPGNLLYTVLKHMESGLLLKSDQSHVLHMKRLCQCRVFAFSSYGEADTDSNPLLLARDQTYTLFSYKKFMIDW
uniref:IRF tryptophan pentad repeat domain-containing protein n=1 Tax=Ciona savignyi TaxID=51511 RepID=H2ZCD0_CIOSA